MRALRFLIGSQLPDKAAALILVKDRGTEWLSLPAPPLLSIGAATLYLQAVPLTANDVGIWLVLLFQVPLNPTPTYVVPAGMLPL